MGRFAINIIYMKKANLLKSKDAKPWSKVPIHYDSQVAKVENLHSYLTAVFYAAVFLFVYSFFRFNIKGCIISSLLIPMHVKIVLVNGSMI